MTPLLAQRPRTDRGFERLYRKHVGDVYRYALAVMRNEADAEDVTQTTFMNALRAFQRGERPEKPQNWLIAIAHNVCRQRFRQSARRPAEVAFDDDIGTGLLEPDDETPTGDDIRRALGHLAFNQRAALVMRELEGRSYAEIAEILDLSPSAVETLIFRARRALREQLETSLTCGEAELAISKQLDGRLKRNERAALRAHLRECKECATFARRQRAQRTAIRSLAAVPIPTSLTSLFGGGGGAALGTGLAIKAAAALTAGAIVGGAGYEGVQHAVRTHRSTPHVSPTVASTARASVPAAPAAAASERTGGRAGTHATRAGGKHAGVVKYHGDASVAARHNHLKVHRTHPIHPTHAANPHKTTAPGRVRSKPRVVPPGPYEGGPPSKSRAHTHSASRGGTHGGGGNGKGK
ncbi:MAG: sigma-70 family RNA polymerase sigma factor [Actinobacteria bacterium]|nr:MAG: sigma-70 family RNA polymerase sigma factor [Actinomycetota bacterium]